MRLFMWTAGLTALSLSACSPKPSGSPAGSEASGAALTPSAPTPAVKAPPEIPSVPTSAPSPAQEAPVNVLEITLTHDFVCPWCRLGHVRLKKAIEASGRAVRIRYQPYMLEPSLPEAGVDFQQHMAAKFGPEGLKGAQDRLSALGTAEGLTFHFDRIKLATPTLKAHVLLGAAPEEKATAFIDALHVAYFENGEPLASNETLLKAWTSVGLEAAQAEALLKDSARLAAVAAEAEKAARSGVRGVPQMVIGGAVLQGAQAVDVITSALQRAP